MDSVPGRRRGQRQPQHVEQLESADHRGARAWPAATRAARAATEMRAIDRQRPNSTTDLTYPLAITVRSRKNNLPSFPSCPNVLASSLIAKKGMKTLKVIRQRAINSYQPSARSSAMPPSQPFPFNNPPT